MQGVKDPSSYTELMDQTQQEASKAVESVLMKFLSTARRLKWKNPEFMVGVLLDNIIQGAITLLKNDEKL